MLHIEQLRMFQGQPAYAVAHRTVCLATNDKDHFAALSFDTPKLIGHMLPVGVNAGYDQRNLDQANRVSLLD